MKNFFKLSLVLVAGLLSTAMMGQEFPDLDKSPLDMAYYPARAAFRAFADTPEEQAALQPVMRVIYSRPQKNERDVFPDVVKNDEVWRIGANESTEIDFFRNVRIGGQLIPAGRYTLHAMVMADEWTIYVSTDADGWGSYSFKPDASTVATVTVPVSASREIVEALSIVFEEAEGGAHMVIAWDDVVVRVPIMF